MAEKRRAKSKKRSVAVPSGAKPYEPTPSEEAALKQQVDKRRNRTPMPQITISENGDGHPELKPVHPDRALGQLLLMHALGSTNVNFLDGIMGQLANAGSHGPDLDERGLNFMLSVIQDIQPRDQLETMLAAQMASIHMATMTFARRLAHVDNVPQQDSAERAFNKLARTFVMQMEALKRYRTSGHQKVTVEHVTVNEGGQAIVGNVSAGGGGQAKKSGTTP